MVAKKAEMLPEPEAASPTDGALFVQLNVVPLTVLTKLTGEIASPLQTVWLPTELRTGVGLTLIVNITAAPLQPFAIGVTEMIARIGDEVLFIPVNDGMFPVPLAARPIEGLSFVQLYVVPAIVPEKLIAVVFVPLHIV